MAVRGRIASDERGALRIDDLVSSSRTSSRAARCARAVTELTLAADAFALDGWDELVPPLGIVKPTGRVAIPKLALALDPLAVRGEIALDDLVATPPDMAPVALKGALVLSGSELRTRDLVARAAEQPIRIDAHVAQLFDGPRYQVSFETQDADTNALLAGYAKQKDRLIGPLDLKGTLRGTTGGGASLLDAMSGELALDIEHGRIVGVSLIEAVLGSFGRRVAEALQQQGKQGLGALHERPVRVAARHRCTSSTAARDGAGHAHLSRLGRAARRSDPARRPRARSRRPLTISEALDARARARVRRAQRSTRRDARRSTSPRCAASSVRPRCSSSSTGVTQIARRICGTASRRDKLKKKHREGARTRLGRARRPGLRAAQDRARRQEQ
jgi:hypothetical protein